MPGNNPDRINRRRFLQTTAAGAAAVGLAGCTGNGGNETTTTGGNETTTTGGNETTTTSSSGPKMGGELIATFGADVKNFDPTKQNDTTSTKAFQLVYETLMMTDFDGKPQPYLLKSIEKTGDLTFRGKLREGIKFHNGNELTTADVKASLERYKGTPRESDVYDWYGSSSIVDDYTIDITLQKAYAPFYYSLSNPFIVPKEVAEGDIDLKKNPVGTGPYKFVEHKPDEVFRIERNEDYWFQGNDAMPEKPPIEKTSFRVIVEQSAQLAALQGGDVDFMNNPPAQSVSDLKSNDKFNVTERVEGGYDMLIYPMHEEADTPWQNRKVRQATNRLIPRDAIVKSVYNGIGIPAYSPISPLAAQFTSTEFNNNLGEQYAKYDKEKALSLLEEGFSEAGFDKPYSGTMITNQNPQRVKWTQLIQESLNSTEYFDMQVNQFEWNTYIGKILAKDSYKLESLVSLGWSAGWDPDNYINNLFNSKKATPACCNINHYQNDKVDELIQKGLETYDLQERQQIYKDLQTEIVKDSPMAFIRFGKAMDVMIADTVKNWSTYPIDGAEYAGIYAPYGDKYAWVDK